MEYVAIEKSEYEQLLGTIKKAATEIRAIAEECRSIRSGWRIVNWRRFLGSPNASCRVIVNEVFWAFRQSGARFTIAVPRWRNLLKTTQ